MTKGQKHAMRAIIQNWCRGLIGARTMRRQIMALRLRP